MSEIKHVLLVDDNPYLLKKIIEGLVFEGLEVDFVTASNSTEAMRFFEAARRDGRPFWYVFSDNNMVEISEGIHWWQKLTECGWLDENTRFCLMSTEAYLLKPWEFLGLDILDKRDTDFFSEIIRRIKGEFFLPPVLYCVTRRTFSIKQPLRVVFSFVDASL